MNERALQQFAALMQSEVLFVHAAFKQLSRQGLRCQDLIHELARSVGNLLMPAMSWRIVGPSAPFSAKDTPGHVGALAEVFRTEYATHRSLHPTHSVCALGKQAAYLTSMHHIGTTPVSICSPHVLARDWEAKILMLGTDLETCTALHCAEEALAPEVYVAPAAEAVRVISREGAEFTYSLKRHTKIRRDFNKYLPLLEAEGALRRGQLAGVPWILIDLAGLMRISFAALARNRLFNLRDEAKS